MLPRPWQFSVYKASSEPPCSTRHSSELMPPRYLSGPSAIHHPSWFPCFRLNWHLLFLSFGRYTLETLIPEACMVCPSRSTSYSFSAQLSLVCFKMVRSHQNAAASFHPCVPSFSLHSHKGTHVNLHCLCTRSTCTFCSENVPWEAARIANGSCLPFTYRYLRLCVVAEKMAIR